MGPQSITNPTHYRCNPVRIALAFLSLLIAVSVPAQSTISTLNIPLILPSSVVVDATGNLYIAETGNHVIRRVDPQGSITTIAGTGIQGLSGDNGPATSAQLDSPQGLALRGTILYIADTHNHRIRKLDLTSNIITTIAGVSAGFDGDSGAATSAHLNLPTALTLDANQNLYVADTANHRIRRIDASTGIITTIGGNGNQGYSGDGAQATQAAIDSPTGLAADPVGNLYLADTHNHRIRRIATTGIITTVAGTGILGSTGDNASAATAGLALPHDLTIDPQGNLYLADTANHRLRRIDATTGIITTVAGTGTQGYSGDNGPATTANLDSPRSIAISPATQLTIADTNNQRVRQLSSQTGSGTTPPPITTPADFTLTATGSTSQTIPSGTTATFTFTAPSQGNLASPIILSASSLPLGATATFNPNLIPPGANFPNFTLTITTLKLASIPTNKLAPILATLILPLLWLKSRRRTHKLRPLLSLFLLPAATLITACGARINTGNSQTTTQPQTYNITITATATTPTGSPIIHSVAVTLTLQ